MYNILSSYRSQNSMILGKNGWEVMESFEINLSIYDILTFDFFFFLLNSVAREILIPWPEIQGLNPCLLQ